MDEYCFLSLIRTGDCPKDDQIVNMCIMTTPTDLDGNGEVRKVNTFVKLKKGYLPSYIIEDHGIMRKDLEFGTTHELALNKVKEKIEDRIVITDGPTIVYLGVGAIKRFYDIDSICNQLGVETDYKLKDAEKICNEYFVTFKDIKNTNNIEKYLNDFRKEK